MGLIAEIVNDYPLPLPVLFADVAVVEAMGPNYGDASIQKRMPPSCFELPVENKSTKWTIESFQLTVALLNAAALPSKVNLNRSSP